jgi:hypothetical protein
LTLLGRAAKRVVAQQEAKQQAESGLVAA